jgi:LmbE family N-acetylglucosaminyl deacetylase
MLVVAPHADDETLGCGGLLAIRSAHGGGNIHVAFVSDSAGSPEADPPAGLAARRRAEALAALAVLGVPAGQAHFLDAPDGRLGRLDADRAAQVGAALVQLLQQLRPGEMFVPYLGGGSSEHDATVHLARAALARSGVAARVWEYPVWAWWDARRLAAQLSFPRQNFRLELGPARTRKRQALACHASQLEPSARTGEPGLPPVLAALCTGPREFFFLRPS